MGKLKHTPPAMKAVRAAKTILWRHYCVTESAMIDAVVKADSPEAKLEAARKWVRGWLGEICGYAESINESLSGMGLEDIPGSMIGDTPCMNIVEEVTDCVGRFQEEADELCCRLDEAEAEAEAEAGTA